MLICGSETADILSLWLSQLSCQNGAILRNTSKKSRRIDLRRYKLKIEDRIDKKEKQFRERWEYSHS